MAMTKCRECGKDISDQATACPHCGAPVAPAPDPALDLLKKNTGCLLIFGLVFLLLVLFACLPSRKREAPQTPAPAPEISAEDAAIQSRAIEQFRGLPLIRSTEWVDGDFVIAAGDNGKSWQPVADEACGWLRSQGYTAPVAVVVLEASALRNRKWEQLARARCN